MPRLGATVVPVDPVDALRRIAFLLERDSAPTFKVKAFRRAATGVAAVPHQRLLDLAGAGRLQDIDGVGDTTAAVVTQALAGSMPEYLLRLEESPAAELPAAVLALRQKLRGDCHSHSDWSDGGSPIRDMAEAARDVGHEYLVLTDHSPRLTVAHGLDADRLRRQLEEVALINADMAPFRLLTGIEVDIFEDGTLDQDEDLLAGLDVVVASVHSKLKMDQGQMTARMVRAIENPNTDILGHCTGRLLVGRGRDQSQFDPSAVFAACARTGTALEINSRPERRDPPLELLRTAIEEGCMFSIDTDAHAPGQLEWMTLGCEQAVEAAVPQDRIVNSWDAEGLVAWAASHSP